ncbi:MAG: hypothetical protein UT30_C0001G0080 [Candidatus Uhrbacteria bacterium GW2011_GWF2_39_13]|uniref:Uncharacterized protein n=1 Tax=Candidatus Uhrbacteria bacterium GW2011_GWF2_39_13 TaxID=1618995 RepID=A0A0G0MXD0_9BACT|nr:MAG: hypothetical protein UT30_C0001G0080 [Candidatus Uhrbacteria bacterium GW2011_GWF2_39_13]
MSRWGPVKGKIAIFVGFFLKNPFENLDTSLSTQGGVVFTAVSKPSKGLLFVPLIRAKEYQNGRFSSMINNIYARIP